MFPSPRAEARAGRPRPRRRAHRPVFVDDSGRRHRFARIAGTATGSLAFAYVVIVGATFAGVPGLGDLDAPGVGQLTNPAGERADVGRHPVEQAIPAAVDGAGAAPGEPGGSTSAEPSPTAAPGAATTSTAPATTTTTVVHGNASPNSTVPDQGGGPPTSRPGRP